MIELIDLWHGWLAVESFVLTTGILTFLVIAFATLTAGSFVADGIVACSKPMGLKKDFNASEGQVFAKTLAAVFFSVFFIYRSGDFSGDIFYFLDLGIRSLFAAVMVTATLTVLFTAMFVVAEHLRQARQRTSGFVTRFYEACAHVWSLRPRWPQLSPVPVAQVSEAEKQELALQRIRQEYEHRCDMLRRQNLGQLEFEAIKEHLNQEFLRSMHKALYGRR